MARPQITDESKKIVVQRLEPYLKAGLSIRKACLQAQIPRSTVYYFMERDPSFLDQITRFQQYLSVILTNSLFTQLCHIVRKQNENKELSKTDIKFLFWYVLHCKQMSDQFGRRINIDDLYDPELEIQRLNRLIDDNSASCL